MSPCSTRAEQSSISGTGEISSLTDAGLCLTEELKPKSRGIVEFKSTLMNSTNPCIPGRAHEDPLALSWGESTHN